VDWRDVFRMRAPHSWGWRFGRRRLAQADRGENAGSAENNAEHD
jgi:hypothetical protein